ncbi:Sel1 domain protein repeat-containing protein [Alkalilimnicola ehrlichii MLHE-1]|uniref:Sel1 domain protein repeat-containing protein n=2 Tax=Alkalilimnicola ehrlichii TaxID=351052 RepID=Q0AC17_ALKEH|nr:Sel1 domain protein repeat-containing protein [Alkalilimnicola ehrlichii MLHE-1]
MRRQEPVCSGLTKVLAMPRKKILVFILIVGLWAGTAQPNDGEDKTSLKLNAEQQQAKEEGMRLWGLHEWIDMQPPLEEAAGAGDVEAIYYLGEANRLLDRGMSREAIDWYHRAAQGGDPHAMLRLEHGMICKLADICPEKYEAWVDKALEQELPKAEHGDPIAMSTLFDVYNMLGEPRTALDWLERAAEAGNPEAQDWLGTITQERSGEWPPQLKDVEAAEPWFRKAAEQGYAPAIYNLVGNLIRQEKMEAAWNWVVEGSERGHIRKRITYGFCHLAPGELIDYCYPDEPDPVKGWAILHALYEETRASTAESLLERYGERLSDEEIAEAEELAEDWLNREPPLSYFPPKYGL